MAMSGHSAETPIGIKEKLGVHGSLATNEIAESAKGNVVMGLVAREGL